MSAQTLILLDATGQQIARVDVPIATTPQISVTTAKTLLLLETGDKEIARVDLTPTTTNSTQASPPPEIPKTLEWYREAAKWLTATSAATLVLGLGYFGETRDLWLRWIFTISGVLLIVALGSGALTHLWIIEFGKLWEKRGNLTDDTKKQANQNQRERYLQHMRLSYYVVIGATFVGILGFGIACGIRMWRSLPKPSLIVTSRPASDELMLTNPSNGETWVAVQDSGGGIVWKRKIPPQQGP